MDSAIRIAVVVVMIGLVVGLIATIGIPALPEEADQIVDQMCLYLRDGRALLNYLMPAAIINGCLACVIIIKNLDKVLMLYGYVRKWFLG